MYLREYQLPAWACGKRTLVVASSHSGNTEEVLSVFDQALKRNCSLMVVSTGGKLSQKARENALPVWNFTHAGQPRSAVGYSFGFLLALAVPPKINSRSGKDIGFCNHCNAKNDPIN